MAGRPLPTALKAVKGTLQKCRTNKKEPKPESIIPEPPEFITGIALEEWKRASKLLLDMRVLTSADGVALAAYCDAYRLWVEATEMVRKSGILIKTVQGNVIQNPALGVANKARQDMVKYLIEFGMTPASRPRVSASDKKDDDDGWGGF